MSRKRCLFFFESKIKTGKKNFYRNSRISIGEKKTGGGSRKKKSEEDDKRRKFLCPRAPF